MRAIGLLFALCTMLVIGVGAADARELTKKQQAEATRFAANNSLFVLYHEVAHLLIHQLDLPVLGREEDAADNMATWTLLNRDNEDREQALADAAYGWLLSGLTYGNHLDDTDYYAAHSLDRQRAFQIVCLMVGSNDSSFKSIASEYAIDADRQNSCHWDYQLMNRSFRTLLEEPTAARARKGGSVVNVSYHYASGALKPAADAFRASGVFDQVADELRQHYNLPKPIIFNAQRCGEANAYYDPETVEIIFCYEMMQDFIDLYAKEIPKKGVSAGPRITGINRVSRLPRD